MSSTRYFEAHGTGTAVGDPTEARAIANAFDSPDREPIYVGAVKSNIGHLEGASGIAGLIKSVLVLERGVIPANMWLERVNPKIKPDEWGLKFPTQTVSWPSDGPRRASVNSFGFGGTNAHAILDGANDYLTSRGLMANVRSAPTPPVNGFLNGDLQSGLQNVTRQVVTLSSFDEAGIDRLTSTMLQAHMSGNKLSQEHYLEDVAFTLNEKRTKLPWRSYATMSSKSSLQELVWSEPVRAINDLKLCFVFTGQGAQWKHMGQELLRFKVFSKSIERAERFLRSLGCFWSIAELLFRDHDPDSAYGDVDDARYSQPLCTIVQVALVDLLESWGVTPAIVVGHSSGEIAAAYCSKSISQEMAWKISYYRGLAVSEAFTKRSSKASMMAVQLSPEKIQPYLSRCSKDNSVTIACFNSPTNVTVSGTIDGLDELSSALEKDGVLFRRLKVPVGYHSSHMAEAGEIYRHYLQRGWTDRTQKEGPLFISTVTESHADPYELQSPEYWVANLVNPVKFSNVMRTILNPKRQKLYSTKEIDARYIVELGPHSTLRSPLKDILKTFEKDISKMYSTALVRNQSAMTTILNCVGELSCAGYPVSLSVVNGELGQTQKPQLVTTLPPYPFNHSQSYWSQSRLAQSYRFRKSGRHELLGTPVPDWNTLEPRWNNTFMVQDMSFLTQHIVNGMNLYPAAGMLVMAIEASRQLADEKAKITGFRFKDVTFSGALPLSDGAKGTETQLFLRPTQESVGNTLRKWDEFRLCVWDNNAWRECCRGAITTEYESKSWSPSGADEHVANMEAAQEGVKQTRENCRLLLAKKDVYGALEKMGLTYGPTFQGLDDIRVDNRGSATGSVDLQHWRTADPSSKCKAHLIHPAALDAVLQLAFPALAGAEGLEDFPTAVPTSLRSLWISSSITGDDKGSAVEVCATSRKTGLRDIQASFTVSNKSTGRIDLTIDACMTAVDRSVSSTVQELDPARRYYKVAWQPDTSFLKHADQLDLATVDRRKDSVTSKTEADTYTKKEWLCLRAMTAALDALPATYEAPKAHLQRYIDWMKRKLRATSNDAARYAPIKAASEADPSQFHDSVKTCDAEGFILAKITASLPQLLSGDVDSLQFLFADDSLQAFYNQDWAVGVKDQVRSYARAVGHKTPGLRVLEVGAGTGGLTTLMLEGLGALPDTARGTSYLAEYAYTDISPSFFMQAKQQFGEVNMKYQTLDIAAELEGQGFQEGYYDVVAASNVLHATADLDVTLKNCRRLLKKGGKLILHENMNPERITSGMIFGLLPGWWLSTEENRRWSPLQSRADWDATLRRAGFSGEEMLLEGTDERNLDTSPGAVMVSTAVSQEQPGAGEAKATPPVMLIYDESSEAQLALRREIEHQHATSHATHRLTSHSLCTASTLDFTHATVLLLPSVSTLSLQSLDTASLSLLQHICSTANALIWLGHHLSPTGSPDTSMATGMGRAIESENLDLSFVTLTIECTSPPSLVASHIWYIISQSPNRSSPTYENEYAERNSVLYIPRIVEDVPTTSAVTSAVHTDPTTDLTTRPLHSSSPSSTALTLGLESVGLLDTFVFSETPAPTNPLAPGDVQIAVLATGLNFVDVLTALGQVSRDYIGNEFAGRVVALPEGDDSGLNVGDVVMGCHNGTMTTQLRCRAWQVHRIPAGMSVVDAAALPLVYCTVYYALVTWARAQPGESVLIHSGAGGVGQAAIQMAKVLGLTVYTTTSSEEKAALLRDTYGIPAERVFSSRSLDFAPAIRRLTGGRGVDIVLNSLSGEALRDSFDLVAPFGRFVELGKRDIYATGMAALGGLPMRAFERNIMFASVDLPSLYLLGDRISGILKEVVKLAEEGQIAPPAPVQVYKVDETEQAFRMMQSGKNVGKIVIDYEAEAEVKVRKMGKGPLFEQEATYVIAGGLGGIAKSIAKWMVKRGARNLVLLSRSTPKGADAEAFFQHLDMYGAKVVHFACDVADEGRMKEVLGEVQSTMPPIKGCIQAAMVLEVRPFSFSFPFPLSLLSPAFPLFFSYISLLTPPRTTPLPTSPPLSSPPPSAPKSSAPGSSTRSSPAPSPSSSPSPRTRASSARTANPTTPPATPSRTPSPGTAAPKVSPPSPSTSAASPPSATSPSTTT